MATLDGPDDAQALTTRRRTSKPVAQADGSVKEEAIPELEGPQVQYIGPASRRILGPDDWETLGISDADHKKYVWDLSNSKCIRKSEFSPQQLDYLRVDGRFQIDEG